MFIDESVKVFLMKYMFIKDFINVNNKLIFDMINNFIVNCEILFSIIFKYVNLIEGFDEVNEFMDVVEVVLDNNFINVLLSFRLYE